MTDVIPGHEFSVALTLSPTLSPTKRPTVSPIFLTKRINCTHCITGLQEPTSDDDVLSIPSDNILDLDDRWLAAAFINAM